jgi:hypothetical protein
MPAGYQELFLEQGSEFNTSVMLDNADGSPYNLENCLVKATMKKSYYSNNSTTELTVDLNDPGQGVIILSLTYEQTANIAAGRYVYDVAVKDSSNTVSRVLEGIVNVSPRVTVF